MKIDKNISHSAPSVIFFYFRKNSQFCVEIGGIFRINFREASKPYQKKPSITEKNGETQKILQRVRKVRNMITFDNKGGIHMVFNLSTGTVLKVLANLIIALGSIYAGLYALSTLINPPLLIFQMNWLTVVATILLILMGMHFIYTAIQIIRREKKSNTSD
jgi:hypothetical protein